MEALLKGSLRECGRYIGLTSNIALKNHIVAKKEIPIRLQVLPISDMWISKTARYETE